MNTRTLLADHIAHRDLCPGSHSVDEWLGARWLRFRFGDRLVPVLPLWGIKRALLAHDVHHAVLGHGTDLRGEVTLAAWEIASGGCGWNLGFWIDRIGAALVGVLCYPRATWRAIRQGYGSKNLYGEDVTAWLDRHVDDLRRRLGAPDEA